MRLIPGYLHQFSNTLLIDGSEWVIRQDLQLLILRQETTGIVAAHAQSGLGQVVRSKAEKLCLSRQIIGNDGSTRNFQHDAGAVREKRINYKDLLKSIAGEIRNHNVACDTKFLDGEPSEEVVKTASSICTA